MPFLRSRTYTAPDSGSSGTTRKRSTDCGNSIQRTICAVSVAFSNAATAVSRLGSGLKCTMGRTDIRPNMEFSLSRALAQKCGFVGYVEHPRGSTARNVQCRSSSPETHSGLWKLHYPDKYLSPAPGNIGTRRQVVTSCQRKSANLSHRRWLWHIES